LKATFQPCCTGSTRLRLRWRPITGASKP
jgi:hypothetical protein